MKMKIIWILVVLMGNDDGHTRYETEMSSKEECFVALKSVRMTERSQSVAYCKPRQEN